MTIDDIEALMLEHAGVVARVAPARGALVTALSVHGRDVLFMDRSTLVDPAKSVRGGIPLLFPFAGRLADDRLAYCGSVMKQHGFARNQPWRVVEQRAGFARLCLEDDAGTRAVYPHAFHLEHAVTLLPQGLQLSLLVHNKGDTPMPVSPGWHPYFRCASAARPQVQPRGVALDASRFSPEAEFDFGVTAPATGRVAFQVPELGRLELSFSPEMRFLQCWGLPGRDFICLEPFFGPNNTINTPARLELAPGQAHVFWMRIELD